MSIFENEIDYSYFVFFHENTAVELSGYFETDIWNCLVLQMAHEEPFARQAIIAIGALTMTTNVTAASMNPEFFGPIARRHYDYALRQYGKLYS